MFEQAIVISLKPKFAELVYRRKKNYEFRKYKPKRVIRWLWIYISSPVQELRYIIEAGDVVIYPAQIPETGVGNRDFNLGLKKAKFAFSIIHLWEIVPSIPLQELRRYDFAPPQSFVYIDKYNNLVSHIVSNFKIQQVF